jgi:hypothetical protein
MNTKANVKAIQERLQGGQPSRYRAVAMASAAGVGVGTLVYRALRGG